MEEYLSTAVDYLRLVVEAIGAAVYPTWTAVATTALTIAVRQLIVFSLGQARRE